MADNLPLSSVDVIETGSRNLPEPSGPHRPVMGLLYFTFIFQYGYIQYFYEFHIIGLKMSIRVFV
jgi:hypothetical protein